jgi:tetratricopeptide (TPR) repeat protein
MSTSKGMLSSEATRHKNLMPVLICLALAILTVITFWSLKDCGFINFDDNRYVYENAYVQSGLNWNNIRQAFSTEIVEKSGFWHPVTWLSLMLDYQIFGLNPHGYHLINLLFHVMNTILLFLILHRMTKTLWPSAFVAALFAIHPLHVESVAWIAERKDVLSTFFWMLTMGAYSYYVEHPGLRRYFFVLLFFILGLMSKPMLVTLPFVLLLLDYWPLQRFGEITGMNPKASFGNRFESSLRGIKPSAARDNSTNASNFIPTCRDSFSASLIRIGVSTIKPDHKVQTEALKSVTSDKQKKKSKTKQAVKETLELKKPADPEYKWSLIYPLLWEKVPLFVLAILSSVVTYITVQKVGVVHSEAFPLSVRIENAFVSYIAYIGKMIWPNNLAVFYPHPMLLVVPWQVLWSVLLLIAITSVVIWMVKRSPYLATGWLWYAGTLVPVSGIVQVGSFAMADRYTYIPLIGLFIMVAWGFPDLLKKWNYQKEMLLILSALSILCLCIITWTQVGYWQNSITLFDHTLKVTDYNWIIHHYRGNEYTLLGNYRQAIEDYDKAIEIKPGYADAYTNRGAAYNGLGNYRQAIEDYDKAIEIKPGYADAYYNRGLAYNGLGNYRQAIEDYDKAIEIKPGYADAYTNRGAAYNGLGNYRQAIENYGKAIEIKPDFAMAYYNRGNSYTHLGNYKQAIEDFGRAIEIKPGYADAYFNRGLVYLNQGDNISGCRDARKACELGICKLLETANTKGLCR